jgi:hypothetical protein
MAVKIFLVWESTVQKNILIGTRVQGSSLSSLVGTDGAGSVSIDMVIVRFLKT